MGTQRKAVSGQLVGEAPVTLAELCRLCGVTAEWVVELVDEGIIEPLEAGSPEWRFPGASVRRVYTVVRLTRDLRINLPGAALAVELIEERDVLQARLRALEVVHRSCG